MRSEKSPIAPPSLLPTGCAVTLTNSTCKTQGRIFRRTPRTWVGWVSPLPRLAAMKLRSLLTGMNTGNGTARRVLSDLMILRDLLESGQIDPVIDRNYKLEEVIDALTYQGTFHARGKIVVTV